MKQEFKMCYDRYGFYHVNCSISENTIKCIKKVKIDCDFDFCSNDFYMILCTICNLTKQIQISTSNYATIRSNSLWNSAAPDGILYIK